MVLSNDYVAVYAGPADIRARIFEQRVEFADDVRDFAVRTRVWMPSTR